MYVVITEHGIYSDKTLDKLNKKNKLQMAQADFKPSGNDFIVTLSNNDYEYVKDLNRISQIPIGKLFKQENTSKIILYVMLAIQIILLVKK
jgi:hypothetical protein